ncbi:MAG: hypothetical protein H0U70_08910 [Tatlockia sp.]|nr:hypothetical protein [Tatlockia sp.]
MKKRKFSGVDKENSKKQKLNEETTLVANEDSTEELTDTEEFTSGFNFKDGCSTSQILRRLPTPIAIRADCPTRSNSIHFNSKGKTEQLRPSTRNYIKSYSADISEWQDEFKIAIVSLEASAQHYKKYHAKAERAHASARKSDESSDEESFSGEESEWSGDEPDNSKNRSVETVEEIVKHEGKQFYNPYYRRAISQMKQQYLEKLKAKLSYHSSVKNYQEALAKLFTKKETPHVVVIIEGNRQLLEKEFTLHEMDGSVNYKLDDLEIKGSDDRQNMHFYIREDMTKAIIPKEAIIGAGHSSQFSVGEIHFETKNRKYSILVPHIPNALVSTISRANNTHSKLESYALEKELDRTVVGYIGDTNYKEMRQDFSSPSTGGNQGEIYVSATSSGAQKHSYFMQAVTFGKGVEDESFLIAQPSTLNQVMLKPDERNYKTATDHPSIQTGVLLDSEILNRDYSFYTKIKEVGKIDNEDEDRAGYGLQTP